VLLTQVGITLGEEVKAPSSVTEVARTVLGRLTTTSSDYGTVVTYTVPAATVFVMSAIEVACSNYIVAQFRLTIAGVEQFAGKSLQTTFNPTYALVNLAADAVVLLEAKSDGSTSIDVDGAIEGKEVS